MKACILLRVVLGRAYFLPFDQFLLMVVTASDVSLSVIVETAYSMCRFMTSSIEKDCIVYCFQMSF